MEIEDSASNTNYQDTQTQCVSEAGVDITLLQESNMNDINLNPYTTQQETYTEDANMGGENKGDELKMSELNSDTLDRINSNEPVTIRRLMIYKIELKNFKSYAGEKTIGPLHKCYSTVVGPNGSGKSNLIESLLFVFGYRAKKLRTNKISHLIHKSEQYPH